MTDNVCIWLKYIVLDCSPVSLFNRLWVAQLTAANTDRKQGLWQLFQMSAYQIEGGTPLGHIYYSEFTFKFISVKVFNNLEITVNAFILEN